MPRALLAWWTQDLHALVFGLAAGIAWGLLAAGSSVPRGYLASDGGTEVAYLYGPNVTTIPAAIFLEQHYDTTVKVFIAYLLFVGLAGWVTWQWVRDLRGAGPLPRLVQGLDRYALALLLGGALGASLFGLARLEAFFNDAYPTTADLIVGLLFVFLPAYGGVGFFLLWARRKRLSRKQGS
ncbi:MAG: hypothetical protein E6I87_11280 [Chloroflexi bacterium]|nr:MAG: hypothetical protein E6I87_11280 [Chloroflexota bacterium]